MTADPLTRQTVDDLIFQDDMFDSDGDNTAATVKNTGVNPDRDDKAVLSPRKRKIDGDDVNVDDEVKISKKQRKQIAKLDAERLLSAPGIPKIRELVRSTQLKKKLRLKGKGHEFSDAARLLNYYQLWLDNLYPRAKFVDALQLVEKAGHSKRMHIMRREWIDQSKPGYHVPRDNIDEDDNGIAGHQEIQLNPAQEPMNVRADRTRSGRPEDTDALFFASDDVQQQLIQDGPDDDELDALMAQHGTTERVDGQPSSPENRSDDEDDLDALLEEQEHRKLPYNKPLSNEQQDTFIAEAVDDDLEALLNEESQDQDASLPIPTVRNTITAQKSADDVEEEGDDTDDFDALVAEELKTSKTTEPSLPRQPESGTLNTMQLGSTRNSVNRDGEQVPELDNTISSDSIPNVDTDDLDQLMDEHDASMKKVGEIVEHIMSSSPVPNEDERYGA